MYARLKNKEKRKKKVKSKPEKVILYLLSKVV